MSKWTVILAAICCAIAPLPPAAAADAAGKSDAYFPLVPGATWNYRVTVKAGDGEPKAAEQKVTVEKPTAPGKPVMIGETAYAATDDGVHVVGILRNAKLESFDEPQKVVPAAPKLGDKWTYHESTGVTSATCLGAEMVKVGAGEFDAVKIYLVTVGGADGGDRREVYRWFAPGVGPVKGSVNQSHRNPNGTLSTQEITMELISYDIPKPAAAATTTAQAAATPESYFAQGEAAARKGNHKTAIALYDAAIAADPKAAKPRAYKTLSLMALKLPEAAEREINQALALESKDYTTLEVAGQLQIAQGKVAQGKTLYDQAATLSPNNTGSIYTDLAAALAMRNDDTLAPDIDKALKTAASADPPSPAALFALGQGYVNAGRPEGKTYLQKYVQITSALPPDQRDEKKLRLAKQLIRAIDAVKGGN